MFAAANLFTVEADYAAEMRSEGTAEIRGANAWTWLRPEKRINPYVQEHTDLVASIRAGRPLNEGRRMAESVLTAIMAREAAYTGQEITWEEIEKSDLDLVPKSFAFGPGPAWISSPVAGRVVRSGTMRFSVPPPAAHGTITVTGDGHRRRQVRGRVR